MMDCPGSVDEQPHRPVAESFRHGILAAVFAVKNKPIIGVVGGIGSGKSFVADLFGEMGCLVIKSDDQVREAYERLVVRRTIRRWWGGGVFRADGSVDREAIARRVFDKPGERRRLEGLLHPLIGRERDRVMRRGARDPRVIAFVWDAPLLFEAGLAGQCDAVVFVEAPRELRVRRVKRSRGWTAREAANREKSQWPLAKKKKMSQYVVRNTAGASFARRQVRKALSHIVVTKVPTA